MPGRVLVYDTISLQLAACSLPRTGRFFAAASAPH